ncbi:MAG: L,D-transpeptidase family protein, partial [Amphritea sp.]|nr:L,D-transpeptidase family protein [Amphritea sp.]
MVSLRLVIVYFLFFSVSLAASASIAPNSFRQQTFTDLSQALSYYRHYLSHRSAAYFKDARLLRVGDRHPQIAKLRYQLRVLGDYSRQPLHPADSDYFDPALARALQRFQYRHGAKVDGILGPHSRRHLNSPSWLRIDQLRVNIHRQMIYEPVLDGLAIRVNIPEFRLHLYQNQQKLMELNTIVGRKKRMTPVFNTSIQALVVNPSWTVPKSIAYKDIIPEWRSNPDYLSRVNLQVVHGYGERRQSVSPDGVDPDTMYLGDNYRYFWEPPGERNTLGRVKFMSRSRYAIYLHDTSAKRLFSEPKRAFSSGCIRVENALGLARLLLELDRSGPAEQLDD